MKVDDFKLRLDPDPILYKKSEEFDFSQDIDLAAIEEKMIEIMLENNGIGISANQVGYDRRVIVIKPQGKDPFAMFNPKIQSTSQAATKDDEGCLSFPELFLPIDRSRSIIVEYVDKDKKQCIIELNGYDAKCVQHEIDHLDGIVFTSHVSSLRLTLAKKKQRKIKKW